MKTKDGYTAEIGKSCFLENGEVVVLDNCARTNAGQEVFLVIPIYVGEAMSADCNGGSHNEILTNYEHKGAAILVSNIFKYPPAIKRLEALSMAIAALSAEQQKRSAECKRIKKLITVEKATLEFAKSDAKKNAEKVKSLLTEIEHKRAELSEHEDSIAALTNKENAVLISKKELSDLNKSSFMLNCLRSGGVDNWEWYDESMKDFHERYPA